MGEGQRKGGGGEGEARGGGRGMEGVDGRGAKGMAAEGAKQGDVGEGGR